MEIASLQAMATFARRDQSHGHAPQDFGLGLVVVGALLCALGLILFVALSFETSGPRTEGVRAPEGAYRETPAAAPGTIAAQ